MAIPIPYFQSRERVQAAFPVGQATPDQFGANIGRELAGLGSTLAMLGGRFREQQEKQADFDAQIAEDQFLQRMQEREAEARQNADPTGKGHTTGFMTTFGQEGEQYIRSLPPPLQQKYRARLANFTRQYAARSATFERDARLGYESNELDRYRDAAVAGLAGRPDDYDAQLAEYENRVNTSGLDAGRKHERIEDFKKRAYQSRLQGLVDANRYDEAKEMERQRGEELRRRERIGPVSQQDRDLMIRTVIGEARGESDEGQAAVANVILNRAGSGRHGKTVRDVVMAPGQFEPWSTRRQELEAISPESAEYRRAAANVDRALAGGEDPTRGATHFYSPVEMARRGQPAPAWARGEGQRIGGHAFYAPEGPVSRFGGGPRAVGGSDKQFTMAGLPIRYVADEGREYGRAATANAQPFRAIVAHHTGSDTLQGSMAPLKGDPSRGGGSFGYHFYIDKDGTVYQGVPLDKRTNHVKGPGQAQRTSRPDIANENAIGISFVGSGGETQAQKDAAARLAAGLMQKYGIAPDNVVGHGEIQGDRQSGEGQALVAAVRSGRGTQTAQAATGTMTDATSQTRSAAESVLPGVGVVDRMIAQRDARLATQANRETADYSQFIRDGNERDPAKEAEFVQRYGPNVGKLAQESFDKDAAYGAKVKSIATATPEELDTIIKDYEERKKSPEDYRINKAELDAIGKIIQDRNATLVKDPATYAARYSPEVRQSAQTMATAARAAPAQLPGLSQDYAAATLAEQARLGVPPELQRIATPEMAAAIGKQFEDNPVNAANLMQGLQAQWGSMWPKVHGEIAKNLPGTAVVIGTMNQPDQAHAAQRLAQLSKIPLKEMEKAYKDEELKGRDGLQQTVLERMRGFRSTLVNNPGAEITFNQFQEAIYKLAMDNMGHGDSVERAASRAYEDVIGKKFTMVGMARIPNEYNSGLIMHGAEQALTQLLPQSDIDLPTATPGGMKPEYFKEQFVRSLQAGKGFWVTSFDQTGLTLMQEPTRKAVTIDGKPFTVSWERLLQLSAGANDTAPLSEHEIIYGLTPQMRSMPAPPPVPEPTASPPPSVPPAQGLTMPGGMP